MRIAVPKEIMAGEKRVALTPEVIAKLVKAGHTLVVEAHAGDRAGYKDDAYRTAGATVVGTAAEAYGNAQVVVKVQRPMRGDGDGAHEADLLREGTYLVGVLRPLSDPDTVRRYAERGVWAFSLDLVPRISRAQAMDVNSSQATVAGYKAVLMAANSIPRFYPLLMTAAGTIRPATVFVIGAGVAGLQAIATARRLGAVVYAFDTRPAAKEHVESLRGKFIGLDLGADTEDKGGYAKALGDDLLSREQAIIAKHLKDADVVIATAQVPGRPAPRLITDSAVFAMRFGSVIVDVAAENGGNCELTVPGKTVVRHDVTIMGPLNLPSEIPMHASDMYARNMHSFLQHLLPKGEPVIDMNDQITRDMCIAKPGEVLFEPVRERLAIDADNGAETEV